MQDANTSTVIQYALFDQNTRIVHRTATRSPSASPPRLDLAHRMKGDGSSARQFALDAPPRTGLLTKPHPTEAIWMCWLAISTGLVRTRQSQFQRVLVAMSAPVK
jgi:hypothetical protein